MDFSKYEVQRDRFIDLGYKILNDEKYYLLGFKIIPELEQIEFVKFVEGESVTFTTLIFDELEIVYDAYKKR